MALIEDGNGRVFPIPRFKAKSTSNENRILHLALRSENGSITIEQPDANEKNVVNFRLFGIGIYFSPFFNSELMRFHFSNYSYNPIKITFLDGNLDKDAANTSIHPIVSCGFLNVKEKRVDGLDSLNISRFAEVPHLLERISKYAKHLCESKSNFEISVDEGKTFYGFPIGISDWIMGRMLKSFLSGTNKIIIKGKTLSDSALNITIVDLNTRIPVIESETEGKITSYQVSVKEDSYTVEFFNESGKLVEKKQNIKRKKERVRLIRFYEERDSASDPKIYDYSDASVKVIESDTPPTLTSTIKPTWRLLPLRTNSVNATSSELQQGKDHDSLLSMIARSHSLAGLREIAEDYDLIRANLPGHFIMALVYAGIKNLTFIDRLPTFILTFGVPFCDFSAHDTGNNFQITDVVLDKQFAHLSKAKSTVIEAEPETLEKHDLVICHGLNRFESPVTTLTNALNSTKLEGNIIIVLSGHQGTEELQNILIGNGFQIQDFNARILTFPKSKELNIRRAIAKTRVIVAKKIAETPTEQSINLEIPLTSRINGNEEIDQLLSLVRTDSKTDSRTILDVVRAFELLDVLMENPETRIDLYNLVTLANHLMEVGFPDKKHFKDKYKIAAASKEEIAAVIKRIEKDLVPLDVSPVATGDNPKKLSGIEKQVVGLSDDMQYYTMTLKLLNWILEQEKIQFF